MHRFLTVSSRSKLRSLTIIASFIGIIFRLSRQQNALLMISSSVPKNLAQSFEAVDSCFEARDNLLHSFENEYLPGPFINVGMPKMGSTSLQNYFCCGNYTSSHWECGKGKGLCADCMKNAVLSGSPPLKSCGNFDAFMQMDRDTFFPQVELLQQIHEESPNATFLLMFRNMTEWYRR